MPYKDAERQSQYWKEYYEKRAEPQRAKSRQYYHEHREQLRAQNKHWYETHKEEARQKARAYYYEQKRTESQEAKTRRHKYQHEHYERVGREQHAKVYRTYKERVFQHYGTSCICCGENNPAVLTIDHLNNDGAEHRRSLGYKGRGANMYPWLIKNNFPEGFQVLCFNCNCARPKGACHPQSQTEPIAASA